MGLSQMHIQGFFIIVKETVDKAWNKTQDEQYNEINDNWQVQLTGYSRSLCRGYARIKHYLVSEPV